MDHTKISENDQRILAARRSLTERFAALEDRVTDTVDQATGTVDHATSALRGTVTDATQSVRSLFSGPSGGGLDLRKQFVNHPWQGMLLAVGAGIAGRMLTRVTTARTAMDTTGTTSINPLSEIITSVRRELVDLGEKAINAASKKLRENIETFASLPAGEMQTQEPAATNGYFHRNGGK